MAKLHIEVDSMGEATGNNVTGYMAENGKVSTGTRTVQVTANPPLESNRFENGRMAIDGRFYPIVDATDTQDANTADTVTIRVYSAFNITTASTFVLYDDDDMDDNDVGVLKGDEGDDVPMPDKRRLTENSDDPSLNVLVPAYIRPVYDIGDNNNSVPFSANVENQDVTNLFNGYFNQSSTHNNTDFWTVYSLGGYQYSTARDGDPRAFFSNGSIQTVYGISDVPERARTGRGLVLFTEEGRDTEYPTGWTDPPISRAYTVAHEVGHLFGCIHADGGLMAETAVRTSGAFDPVCLVQIRTAPNP